jgi:hypothetical protein
VYCCVYVQVYDLSLEVDVHFSHACRTVCDVDLSLLQQTNPGEGLRSDLARVPKDENALPVDERR